MTTKRSATLKQFLLRVHPDRFHRLPRVHDENLRSVQLLNAFLDGGSGGGVKQVHFSLYAELRDASEAQEQQPEEQQLKRYAVSLGAGVETRVRAILRECGVRVVGAEKDPPPQKEESARSKYQQQRGSRSSSSRDRRRSRERSRDDDRDRQRDMDFGSSMHDMYERLRAQNLSRARHKKAVHSMKDFLAFVSAEQTQVMQQQRYNAWLSIQSVKATLQREFGVSEVATSCGWAAVHLNATLMVLLKTLRKYTRAQSGGDSMFTPSAFLRGVSVDISSQPSGIDVNDEYRVHLNPTDVPLQWIEVLEKIDDAMVSYMAAARDSLAKLHSDAVAALGGASVPRGHTCPALGYRGFLQAMAYGRTTHASERSAGDSLQDKLVLVVEDDSHGWQILRNGDVQVPCDASLEEVERFAASNRERIREQRAEWEEQQRALQQIVALCSHALGVKSVTYADTLPAEHVITACEELLKFAAQVSLGSVDPTKVPADLHGGTNRDLASYLRGRQLRITRLFGLDQDGHFTLPVDWYK